MTTQELVLVFLLVICASGFAYVVGTIHGIKKASDMISGIIDPLKNLLSKEEREIDDHYSRNNMEPGKAEDEQP